MIERLLRTSIRFRWAVVLLTALVAAFGVVVVFRRFVHWRSLDRRRLGGRGFDHRRIDRRFAEHAFEFFERDFARPRCALWLHRRRCRRHFLSLGSRLGAPRFAPRGG